MNPKKPPSLATRMLEQWTPGESNEALAGDLLEEFRSGRSCAWYWRQSFAAFIIGWFKSLTDRSPLLVFAALWSMLAPAWTAVLDRIQNNSTVFGNMWKMDWPYSTLSSLGLWLLLNLTFIWTGAFLYLIAHRRRTKAFSLGDFGRAFLLTGLLFNIFYIASFVFMNLFSYPGPVVDRRIINPMGEIADLRSWAVVLRIPYFLTMLCALWGALPTPRPKGLVAPKEFIPPPSFDLPPAPELFAQSTRSGARTITRFAGFLVVTGLLNALIAGIILGRLPDSRTPSLPSLFVRAFLYVALTALAGTAGARFYWSRSASPFKLNPPVPFSLFALVCAATWVWVPSFVLMSASDSPTVAILAVIGAAILAYGLRKNLPVPVQHAVQPRREEIFAETLRTHPFEFDGYIIALSIYAALFEVRNHSDLAATALLAPCAFLIVWKLTLANGFSRAHRSSLNRAAVRLTRIGVSAVFITFLALMAGVAHRNQAGAAASLANAASTAGDSATKTEPQNQANAISGYHSVILWPVPEKKQIVPPLPVQTSLLAPGTTKPLVIRFDGPYYYFQPPAKRPSPTAIQVHGTPLDINFRANNFIPLVMEAHQLLGSSISVARCREVQVAIQNSDNHRGSINLAVLLTDSSSPGKPQFYLGQQLLVSTQPANFAIKSAPASEVLSFPIPVPAKIQKFDQITVMFLPDSANYDVAPNVAIQQFELLPR